MRFHSFDDVQDHLDALGLFHMDFGLDRMRNALDALGLLTPPFVPRTAGPCWPTVSWKRHPT